MTAQTLVQQSYHRLFSNGLEQNAVRLLVAGQFGEVMRKLDAFNSEALSNQSKEALPKTESETLKEKKQLYVKYKSTETAGILDEFELNENEDGTFRQFELYENISEFIVNYENARKEKKAKRAGLEKFVDEDVVE